MLQADSSKERKDLQDGITKLVSNYFYMYKRLREL